jgi:DNA-binding NarL/FixJ family response regulator
MLNEQRQTIEDLRLLGRSFAEIAAQTGVSVNTVKSYCRRISAKTDFCKHCGKPLKYTDGKKKKQFCDDKCRTKWWNVYRRNRKAE